MQQLEKVEFEIVGEIMTKQRPRATVIGGHARVYTPTTTTNYENYIKTIFQNKYPNASFGSKPLRVEIRCHFKASAELEKVAGYDVHRIPCKKHKDLDNVAKIVLDSLNGIAFDDDKQIIGLTCSKVYTDEQESIYVSISVDTYLYKSLQQYKDIKKKNELWYKIMELKSHEKLKKAEIERLDRMIRQHTELNQKLAHFNYED